MSAGNLALVIAPLVGDHVRIAVSTVSVRSLVDSHVLRALSPVLGSALTKAAVNFAMSHAIVRHAPSPVTRPWLAATRAYLSVETNVQANVASVITMRSPRFSSVLRMTLTPTSSSWRIVDTSLNTQAWTNSWGWMTASRQMQESRWP